jgi:hypothetical protein
MLDEKVRTELRALLRRNQRRRRPESCNLSLVEMLIAARLVLEIEEGRVVSAKTLVNEVAPDVVSETTALRAIREMLPRRG